MSDLPDEYQPMHLRKGPKPWSLRSLMYGIGIKESDNTYGMWFGPTPNIQNCLEEYGGTNDNFIIRYNEDGTDTLLYSWNSEKKAWIKIKQELND